MTDGPSGDFDPAAFAYRQELVEATLRDFATRTQKELEAARETLVQIVSGDADDETLEAAIDAAGPEAARQRAQAVGIADAAIERLRAQQRALALGRTDHGTMTGELDRAATAFRAAAVAAEYASALLELAEEARRSWEG